ncbi:unnamed protein product [Adineta steineri]|uniref:Uncharacterized protein n=1 Tax=Adineta steineri TaxID=433720 RepID=A0A814PFK1_9BILA|nr:unnamed protein product [Adineta steineri]CAF1036654.1 unnamed protein product [Adineta steineri]CAF1104711.1 unnamed protein product [Adineta steineri]
MSLSNTTLGEINALRYGNMIFFEFWSYSLVGLQQHTVVRTQHRGQQQQGPQQEQQQGLQHGSQHGLQQESQHEQQHGSQHELRHVSQHELQQGLLQQPQPQHDERQQDGILIVIM